MGQMLKAIQNELVAVDDRSFRWVLRKPYPKMLFALGKISTPCCFIMPARIAATDPFKQINEYVGSGPMRFARSEWIPGARAAFEKFADYVPRREEPSWLAGGKRIVADRIDWIVMPDATTGAAALQTGEIDWLEFVVPDGRNQRHAGPYRHPEHESAQRRVHPGPESPSPLSLGG